MKPYLLGRLSWFAWALWAGTALARDAQPLWNFAWITDTQTPDTEWIATLVARVSANRPMLVLHTGDTRFEWVNRGAWEIVMPLLRHESTPAEFHLAPGNHDLLNGVLKLHLRQAATRGIYRLDTGRKESGWGYYHDRVPRSESGPLWPVWNVDVINHPAWQESANQPPPNAQQPPSPIATFSRRAFPCRR